MPLYPVTPPAAAEALLPIARVKAHLRIDHDDEDDILAVYRDAVVADVDGRDGWLGRALLVQTWDLKLPGWCGPRIRIPLPPLRQVVSVQYSDADEALQTLSPDTYEVVGIGGSDAGAIVLRDGYDWPILAERAEPVAVRFRAGYRDPDADPAGEIPAGILSGVLLTIGSLYQNREDLTASGVRLLPGPAAQLLSRYEVPFIP